MPVYCAPRLRFGGVLLVAAVGWLGLIRTGGTAEIPIPSVLLRLVDQVDVPAREGGVLTSMSVREGQNVVAGSELARIEDTGVQLARRQAAMELELARKQSRNDIRVRFSRKSLEVAEAELQRAVDSDKKYPQSVSRSELEQLRLAVERTVLEIEQAEHELDIARTTHELKATQVKIAEWGVRRHKILAPLDGVVVQVHRHRGEWVKPGEKVLRIVRINRLRAEGFLSVDQVTHKLGGCPATLTVASADGAGDNFHGEVVFVSPEVDPVNGQIRIWAEFDNHDQRLRPGLRGTMTIDATTADAMTIGNKLPGSSDL